MISLAIRTKAALFTLVLLSMALPVQAQVWKRLVKPSGTIFYVGTGSNLLDLGGLSNQLQGQGYAELSESDVWFGTSQQTFLGRFVIGLDASTSREESSSNINFTSTVKSRYATFNLGYTLIEAGTMRAYPTLGVGYGDVSLRIRENESASSFEEVLNNPLRGTTLKSRGWLLNAGMGMDYVLPFKKNEDKQSGLALGLRAGYLHSPASDDWQMLEDVNLGGSPEASLGGAYFRVLIGFGSLSR